MFRSIGTDIFKQPVSSNLRAELHFIYSFTFVYFHL